MTQPKPYDQFLSTNRVWTLRCPVEKDGAPLPLSGLTLKYRLKPPAAAAFDITPVMEGDGSAGIMSGVVTAANNAGRDGLWDLYVFVDDNPLDHYRLFAKAPLA